MQSLKITSPTLNVERNPCPPPHPLLCVCSTQTVADSGGRPPPIDLTNFCINVKSNPRMHQNPPFFRYKIHFFLGEGPLPRPLPSTVRPHYKILDPPLQTDIMDRPWLQICDRKYASIRWNEMLHCGERATVPGRHTEACPAFTIRRQSLRSNCPTNLSLHVASTNTA